jgi:hypothetical protein
MARFRHLWHGTCFVIKALTTKYPVGLFPAARSHAYDPYPPASPREPVTKVTGF